MSSMTEDKTYNGWTNYPTWNVNLWLSNDEGLYEATQDIVHNAIKGSETPRVDAADALRDFVSELPFLNGDVEELTTGFTADLYGWALGQVDWFELADAWIEQDAGQI